MDETTAPKNDAYEHLGYKTLVLFILERSVIPFGALLFSLVMFVLFNLQLPGNYNVVGSFTVNLHELVQQGALLGFEFFFISFLIAIFIGWLNYINYRFQLDEDALKIKRGILNKEVVAIPYRQIQNVDVERSFGYLILGLSKLVILTAGHEDKGDAQDESEGVLPALDKDLADRIQEELLRRANVEKVIPADKEK